MQKYPCPACGFLVFDEPAGSYEICPVCDWEDDPVQLTWPGLKGGANAKSLFEHQGVWIQGVPAEVQLNRGYRRDPAWRPLTPLEARPQPGEPSTGRQYFDAVPEGTPPYYWLAEHEKLGR